MSKLFCMLSTLLTLSVLNTSCMHVPDSPQYHPSPKPALALTQSTFEQYVGESRTWLRENRAMISTSVDKELNANAPYLLLPEKTRKPSKGILLVHGLGDSPYSFIDLAPIFARKGFRVHVMLLPGHGSRPADLENVTMQDWQQAVAFNVALLKNEVDEVWLGGFSTGGNLVTSYALQDQSVAGLFLVSPAYVPKSSVVFLAPFVSNFSTWYEINETNNYVRYESLTYQGAGEYYKTSEQVRSDLSERTFDRPVFIAQSEADTLVEATAIASLFSERFTHPESRFTWYGALNKNAETSSHDSRIKVLPAALPDLRISNFSHNAPLFSPDNTHYGKDREYRACNNGQGELEARCKTEERIWYSAYGYVEEGKVHARLYWNPHFKTLEQDLIEFLDVYESR